MKTILHFLSLLSVAMLVTLTGAETFGASLPSPLLYAVPFACFIASLLLMTFREDYSRRAGRYEPQPVKAILLPASEAFSDSVANVPVINRSWTARHQRVRRAVAHS